MQATDRGRQGDGPYRGQARPHGVPKCECCGEVITGHCITICVSLVAAGKAGQVLAGGAGSPALEVSMADQELMDAKKHGLVSFDSSVKVFEEAAGR